jgi:hypothetical protein
MSRSFPFAKSLRLPVILGVAAALAPFAACSDAASEITAAASHAGFAASSPTVDAVHMHLHHTINCLVGPKGDGFDPKEFNPCAHGGNGAIPDETDDASRASLEAAVAEAKQGLAATDLAKAQASARKTESLLKGMR